MAKENRTVYVLLGLLNHEELTGYEMKKRIDRSLRFFWDAGFGQIYPTLKFLEERGWVEKRSDTMGQKLERILYSITEMGRAELSRWLMEPPGEEVVKYEILLKLFFGGAQTLSQNLHLIEEYGRKYKEQLPLFKAFEAELSSVQHESPDHLYYLLTVRFGIKIYEAYIGWAQESAELVADYSKTIGGISS